MLLPAVCLAQSPDSPKGPRGDKSRPVGEPPRPFAEAWENADTNRDGFISVAEFHAISRIQVLPEEKREGIFKRLDKNEDGNLSRNELMRFSKPHDSPPRKRLWELDADRSGGISLEEFRHGQFFKKLPPGKMKEVFNHLDTDGDGLITPRDRPEPSFKKGEGKPRPNKGPKGPEVHRSEEGDPGRLIKLIRKLDQDADGSLSFEEFRVGSGIKDLTEDDQEDRFNKLDHNGDLKISKEDAPPPK